MRNALYALIAFFLCAQPLFAQLKPFTESAGPSFHFWDSFIDAQISLAAELDEDYHRLLLKKPGSERNKAWNTEYCPVFFEKVKRTAMDLTQTDNPRDALEALLRRVCMTRDEQVAKMIQDRYDFHWNRERRDGNYYRPTAIKSAFLPYPSGGQVNLISGLALALAYERNDELVAGTLFADPDWNAADYANPSEREMAAPFFLKSPFYVTEKEERAKLVFNVETQFWDRSGILPIAVLHSYGDDRAQKFLLEAAMDFASYGSPFYAGPDWAIHYLTLFPPMKEFLETVKMKYAEIRDELIRERGDEVTFLFDKQGGLADQKTVERSLKQLPAEIVRKINVRNGRLPQFIDSKITGRDYMRQFDFKALYRLDAIRTYLEFDASLPSEERDRYAVFRREYGLNRALRANYHPSGSSFGQPENFCFVREGDEKFAAYFNFLIYDGWSMRGRCEPFLLGSDTYRRDEAYFKRWIDTFEKEATRPDYTEKQRTAIQSSIREWTKQLGSYKSYAVIMSREAPIDAGLLRRYAEESRACVRDLGCLFERLKDNERKGIKVDWPTEYYPVYFERSKAAALKTTGKSDLRSAHETLLLATTGSPNRFADATASVLYGRTIWTGRYEFPFSIPICFAQRRGMMRESSDLFLAVNQAVAFEQNAAIVAGTRYAAPDWTIPRDRGMGMGGGFGFGEQPEKQPPELAYHVYCEPSMVVESFRDDRARALLQELALIHSSYGHRGIRNITPALFYLTLLPASPEFRTEVEKDYRVEKARLFPEIDEKTALFFDEKDGIAYPIRFTSGGGMGSAVLDQRYARLIQLDTVRFLLDFDATIPESDRERFDSIRREMMIATQLLPQGMHARPIATVLIREGEERFRDYLRPYMHGASYGGWDLKVE